MDGSSEGLADNKYPNDSVHNLTVAEEKLDELRRLLGKAEGDQLNIVGLWSWCMGQLHTNITQIKIWRRPGRSVDRSTLENLFEVINSREDILRRLIRCCTYLKYVEARLGDRVITNLQEAVWDADIVINGLPSTETREVFEEISRYWKERRMSPIIISLTKGIEVALEPVPHIITPTQMIRRA
ncbi:hypothetical protein MKX01_020466, partial [Papaver californicum]